MNKRLAIIGAGPIGLEAALRGVDYGWTVTVFEKETVGAHVLKWKHVRLFTPLQDNISSLLLSHLPFKPDLTNFLSGQEFIDLILKPVSDLPVLRGKIREGCTVKAVGRRRMLKTDMPGHPLRAERPFQLLVHSKATGEDIVEADVVLDASGVYGTPNWAGESGLPCPGEREASLNITRHLPDLLGTDQLAWAGKSILLIGDGHSAATAFFWFGEIFKKHSATQVHWVVNTDRSRPCVEIADDPLPERRRIVELANNGAENPPVGWRVYRKSSLLKLNALEPGKWEATVGRGERIQKIEIQKILALTGYRPDTTLLEELQVPLSPVTGGAAGLAKSLMDIKDCLSPVVVPPENLRSGEKGFYLIGHKSYGRLNTFLLRSGLQQLEMVFDQLKKD